MREPSDVLLLCRQQLRNRNNTKRKYIYLFFLLCVCVCVCVCVNRLSFFPSFSLPVDSHFRNVNSISSSRHRVFFFFLSSLFSLSIDLRDIRSLLKLPSTKLVIGNKTLWWRVKRNRLYTAALQTIIIYTIEGLSLADGEGIEKKNKTSKNFDLIWFSFCKKRELGGCREFKI